MYTTFIIDFVSLSLLIAAFYVLWKEREHFYSLRPLLPSIICLSLGRISDLLVEHPTLHFETYLDMSRESFELLFATFGNIMDAAGAAFLIFGFITIIKRNKEKELLVRNLETLLPLCSNCKKYRTENNEWMPIEKYLIENGAPPVTHGLCPECATKLYGDVIFKKQ